MKAQSLVGTIGKGKRWVAPRGFVPVQALRGAETVQMCIA